jgi:polar amino acid transport system substrate-binding protein
MSTLVLEKLFVACADLDARPLFWTDGQRQRHGYEPAVADAVARYSGFRVEWKFLNWADFTPSLETRVVDAIWCGCAITPERAQHVLFSQPYAVFNESVLVRAGASVTRPDDLLGQRVGAIAGSTNMALATGWAGCELVAFDGQSNNVFVDMIEALRAGEIDAIVDDEPAFGGVLEDPAFKLAFTVATRNRWGVAMRKDDVQLKAIIDEALAGLIKNEQLATIWDQWFSEIPFPREYLATHANQPDVS